MLAFALAAVALSVAVLLFVRRETSRTAA